jgi:hypothetical protein
MCAFAVFFCVYPSLLHFQRAMKAKRRRNNMETLFGVSEIPCDNRIRELTDGIEPGALSGVFMDNLRTAEEAGALKEYRVLDGGVLPAMDGLWYHASQKAGCGHCRYVTKDGETTYYHSAVAGALVKPGSTRVIPVVPEMIGNGDGEEKQDCGRNAGKRWLRKHGREGVRVAFPDAVRGRFVREPAVLRGGIKGKATFHLHLQTRFAPWLYETVGTRIPGRKPQENGTDVIISSAPGGG